MRKIKFQIKDMHSASGAASIEEKLKSEPGIETAKVNLESQKAVVIYDEQKIQEPAILGLIKSAGDYRAEKITEAPDKKNVSALERFSASPAFPKLLMGLVVVSLGLSLTSLIVSLKAPVSKTAPTANGQPSAQTVQTFEISENNHVRGNFNAPITLVEFSDFECPFCARIFPTMNKILADYEGKARLVYKQFPLSTIHPNAQKAAEASECASEQGKFWEYHDKLFENQPSGFSTDKFKQWAKDVNLNSGQFDSCLDGGKYAQKVQADFQEGTQKGVNGTPATFVNGRLVSGAQPYENFKQIIDNLLK